MSSLCQSDQALLMEQQKQFLEIDYKALEARNFVTDTYFLAPDLINFMVFTAAHAYADPSYYHPAFPVSYKANKTGCSTLAIRSLHDMLTNVARFSFDPLKPEVPDLGTYLPALRVHKTDTDFIGSGDLLHTYRFLCFTLNFNNLFVQPKRLHSLDPQCTVYLVKSLNAPPISTEALTVFHGTSKNKLYSLIRNGAMTLNTVSCGRAYGHGFYCSPDFSMARGHSDGFVCVYALENATDYKKGDSVYVVDKSRDLRLVCIVPKSSSKQVTEYVTKMTRGNRIHNNADGDKKDTMTGQLTNRIHSKRLIADIKRALEFFSEEKDGEEQHGIRIKVDDNACHLWRVYMSRFASDTYLYGDMKRLGIREIELLAVFPHDYPFAPPFVRVLSPRFERWTGHVTYGGSLCAEFLTLSDSACAWQPILSITTVLMMIKELLSLDGRLESGSDLIGVPYGEQEAREAFQVAMKKHGWNTV